MIGHQWLFVVLLLNMPVSHSFLTNDTDESTTGSTISSTSEISTSSSEVFSSKDSTEASTSEVSTISTEVFTSTSSTEESEATTSDSTITSTNTEFSSEYSTTSNFGNHTENGTTTANSSIVTDDRSGEQSFENEGNGTTEEETLLNGNYTVSIEGIDQKYFDPSKYILLNNSEEEFRHYWDPAKVERQEYLFQVAQIVTIVMGTVCTITLSGVIIFINYQTFKLGREEDEELLLQTISNEDIHCNAADEDNALED